MDEKYIVGQFGSIAFTYRRNGQKVPFDIWVTITDVDKSHILIKCNHGQLFMVSKKDVKRWEVAEKI